MYIENPYVNHLFFILRSIMHASVVHQLYVAATDHHLDRWHRAEIGTPYIEQPRDTYIGSFLMVKLKFLT